MSTKSTICSGDNFHLYRECVGGEVRLEISKPDFEASQHEVTVTLTPEVLTAILAFEDDIIDAIRRER